jgi:ubiquinone biosynthesis UbiH/UbiF/VisC/COQ6 family hydroxylase
VAIIGAGLVGGSFAAALSGSGLTVALLEQAPPPEPGPGWDSRIYAISPSSVAFLQSIGAWQLLDPARITPIHLMRVFGDDGASELDFSAYESGVPELAVTVESGRLASAIWRKLQSDPNLRILCPSSPARLEREREGVLVEPASGEDLHARLCVGADGGNSWVRRAAGFGTSSRAYGERGVIANFTCEAAHRNTAFQWFRDDGVLAWLPVGEKIVSMVWSAPDSQAQRLLALSAAEFCDAVAGAGCGVLGALKLVAPPASFPLGELHAERFAEQRVALLGDAAHVVHPLAGQGVNLGLGDAAVLARLLRDLRGHRDPGDASVLRNFERARAEDILAMRWVTDGLHRLFGAKHPAAARIRNLGLNLTNSIPVVKTLLARRAMGAREFTKDIP